MSRPRLLSVAAAVLNQTPLDWHGNQARIVAALQEARAAGVALVCLPELCITGYGCEDAFLAPSVPQTALEVLRAIVPQTRGLIAAIGLPVAHDGGLYNTACLVVDGRPAGFVAKQHLAGSGIHYEPRWFRPWPAGRRAEMTWFGERVPLGDLLFDCGGVRIGFEICEDAWVADRPARRLAEHGVDVILNPSASHFAFGKTLVRQKLVLDAAADYGTGYVYANLVGNEAGRAIYDGHTLIASGEKLLAVGRRFSYADHLLTTAVLDLEEIRARRSRATPRGHVATTYEGCVSAPFAIAEPAAVSVSPAPPDWERSAAIKHEEFARAVPLALFDYLRKSRSRGFVVSISGGADSAAVTCLVAEMVRMAVAELGLDGLCRKLAHVPSLASATTADDLTRALLTCVYQSTRNSSDTTRNAARQLAMAVGAEFIELDVDAIVQCYVQLAAHSLGRELNWQKDDVPLQNIQARARAPSVWLIANLRDALLLATSNRSEAAVGYTTMDGDTCGGLSPIAGIDKAYLRTWLRWLERTGPAGFGPIPALAAINHQAPTAELRPPQAGQTDEADLMPYDVLDAIERAAIRDKAPPVEVFERMRALFPQYPPRQLATWVERFFRLWCRNQWKRERYAPCFHLDDENLDPKTWCRFPILSGNFERELAELRERVEGYRVPRIE